MKKLLLIIPLLVLFSFSGQAYSYTWVELSNPGGSSLWYDPTTIEFDEGIGSVLIKSYNPKTNVYTMFWFVVDCGANKCYMVGALTIDKDDKAISPPDDSVLEGTIKSGSILYELVCPKPKNN